MLISTPIQNAKAFFTGTTALTFFEEKISLQHLFLNTDEKELLAGLYNEVGEIFQKFADAEKMVVAKIFAEKIKKILPRIYDAFLKLYKNESNCGVFIEGLPGIEYSVNDIQKGEYISLIFSFMLGEPFQYLQQNDGKLVGHITPKEGFEMTQSGLSRGNFGWHTDDRLFAPEFRTKWIQLLGIHNPEKAETIIAPIDEIVKKLSPEIIRVLMEKRFEVKMPTSFGFRNMIWSEPLSIIWNGEQERYLVGVPTYNVRVVDAADDVAKNALTQFLAVLDSCKQSVVLDKSSLLVFNNDRVLHGRTAFSGDRLVLRTYVRPDLTALRDKTRSQGYVFDARLLI